MAEPLRRVLMLNLRTDQDYPPLAFALDWVEEIAERVDEVYLITNWLGPCSLPANVTVRSLCGERGSADLVRVWLLWRYVWEAVTRRRVQLAFGHMTPLFTVLAAPLLRLFGRPNVLWYAHGHVPRMLHPAVWAADLCVTSSEAGFGIDTPKRRILSQGVSTRRFAAVRSTPRPAAPITLLNVGRLAPLKRVELCIEAFARLPAEDRARARLRVIGDALLSEHEAYRDGLVALADRLGVADAVSVEPGVAFRDLPALYADAHGFLNCAPLHSIDKAALEALAAGLPALTTNPAYVLALGAEFAPWCVESGDPDELAGALSRLIRLSPEKRAAVAGRFAEVVEARHSLRALADRLFVVFDEALGRPGRPE